MFRAFLEEIRKHRLGGYHLQVAKYAHSSIAEWFAAHNWKPSQEYSDFMIQIGAGTYFGGAFVVYPLLHDQLPSTETVSSRMASLGEKDFFAIGYDGTTEGCYCLPKDGQSKLYWYSWESHLAKPLASDFAEWVERQPAELFQPKVYSAYKPVANLDGVCDIINARDAFKIRLLNYAKDLVRPPGKQGDQLPRYNRIELGITKKRRVDLKFLTVKIKRNGSAVNNDNVEYVSLDVGDLPVSTETVITCYAFDPFNLPFAAIEVEFNPVIDMGSKMRSRYKEISEFL